MRIQTDTRRVHRWFSGVYLVIAIEIAAMIAVFIAFPDPIQRIGAALIVGAMIFLAYQVHLHTQHVRAARTDVGRATSRSTEFALGYLQVRREFHSGIWFWSRLIVLLPGLPVLVYGLARNEPDARALAYGIVAAFAAFMVLSVFVQRSIARVYQRQIDELNRVQHEV